MRTPAFLLSLSLVLAISFANLVHIPLDTEHTITRHMEGQYQKLHFNFTVDKVVPSQDLLFIVNPLDWISNPDILISSKVEFPVTVQQSEHACWMFGADVCPVPASELQLGKVFYISVFCPFTCSFTIEARYNSETILQLNKKETLYFTGETQHSAQGQIVKFTIPPDFSKDYIIIQAVPRDTDSLDYNLALYINRGDSIPSNTFHQAAGLPSWHSGVSYSILKNSPFYCAGCLYTMLISTGDDIVIDVIARELSTEMEINLQERIYDFMYQQQTLYYTLAIDTSSIADYANKDLNIELRPYTGNPDIFVHRGTKPARLDDYSWISQEFGIEAIRISPKDRADVIDNNIDIFYIAVNAMQPSTFSLLAYMDNKINKPLKFGVAETGYVQLRQIETYMLKVCNRMQGKITIGLHVLSGNPDLYVKGCPDNYVDASQGSKQLRTVCQITKEEIEAYNEGSNPPENVFFAASTSLSGNEEISFMNGPPACTTTTGDCSYVVGVYDNSDPNVAVKSHYSVHASRSQMHTVLQLSVPIKHTIEINEYRYYKFTLPDADKLFSVHFQLTPISGDAGLFSSKTDEFLTKEKFGKAACFCAHIITYCGFSQADTPLNGTYYLAVYGFSHAAYTITALVRSSVETNVIQLMEAVPQRFTFPSTGTAQQKVDFRFMTEYDPVKNTDINIYLTSLRGGNFKLLVAEGFVPEVNTAVWASVNNSLTIYSKDQNYMPKGRYFVSVVPYDPADASKTVFDTKNWQFSLQFSSSSKNLIELVDGYPTIGRVSSGRPAFFRFAVNKEDDELQVKITQFGKPLDMYLSTSSDNPTPSAEKRDFYAQNSIMLNRDDVARFCKPNQDGQVTGTYCPLYVGVYTTGENTEDEQEFTISIQKTSALIYLQEGLPDSHPIPFRSKNIDYAINPKKGQDIRLNLGSKTALKVYAVVYNTKTNPHKFEWKGKDSDQYLIQDRQENYGETTLTIPASLWENNEESMVIIRVKNADIEVDQSSKAVFTLTYMGGSFEYLLDSRVTFGRVTADTYQYYRFSARKDSNKPVKVILTPLTSGLPEMYLANFNKGVPTSESYEFRSQDPSNPSITIDNAQGSYYLAVYSPNNCSYSLLFTTLPEAFVQVKGGLPVTVTSNAQHEEGIYLVYNPLTSRNRNFKILYSKEAGNTELYLSSIKREKNVLPSPKQHQASSIQQGFIEVKQNNGGESPKEYMILVKNDGRQTENKATVLITEEGQYAHLPSGKSFKDSVNKRQVNYYYYVSPDLADNEHVEISMVIYSGSPKLVASTKSDVEESPIWTAKQEPGKSSSIELKILRKNELPSKTSGKVLAKGQTLFIGVVGDTNALYDIRITVGKRTMSLEDGIITTGVINKEENKTFTFHSNFEQSEKKVITLVYTILNDDDKNTVNVFPDIEIGYLLDRVAATKEDRRAEDRLIETQIEERKSLTTRVYRFVAKKALYFITLSMPKQFTSRYSMSLNINGLVMLPPNSEMLGYLIEGSSDTYLINIPVAGNLLVQFYECFGSSSISIAKSREDYLAKAFIPQNLTKDSGYQLLQLEPGNVYIKVQSTKGLTMFTPLFEGSQGKGLESAYKLSVFLLPLDQKPPQQLFVPGNKGIVEASSSENGKFHIKWSNVEIVDQKELSSNFKIYETIYLSKSLRALEMASKCQLVPGSEFVFTIGHGEDMTVWSFTNTTDMHETARDKEIEIDVVESDSPIFVRITAKIQPTSLQAGALVPNIPISILYKESEVDEGLSIGKILGKVKAIFGSTGLIIGGFVLIAGVTFGCVKRARKGTKKVRKAQYEMSHIQDEQESRGPVKPTEYSTLQDDEIVEQEQ